MSQVHVAVDKPATLGECPVWSAPEGVLYWADIEGRAIHRYDPATGVDTTVNLPGRPGSFALTAETGRMLVAMEHELVWLDWDSAVVTPWLDLEEAGIGIRLNDGRTDPAGRFIVGSMFEDTGAAKTVGSLHQIEPDGTVRVLRTGVGTANGLGFDPGRGRMYFADTPTLSVVAFDYDLATGAPTNERVFFDYSTIDGKPDGACVDVDGCYWSASVHGWAVVRITPQGELDQRIEVPVSKPTMPAFGGPNLDTLFVTSIGENAQGRDGVAPGALLAIDLSSQNISGVLDAPFGSTGRG